MQPEKSKLDQLKAMFESEIWQQYFAMNISDVIWVADLDLNNVFLSPSAEALSGYNSEEIVKLTARDFLTPASLEKAMAIFNEELASEEAGSTIDNRSRMLEVEQVRKDGSTVWVELNVSFVRDDSGKPIGLFGITRDIDTRKKAEEALRAEQHEKDLILNNLSEQVAYLDPELRIIWINADVIKRHNLESVEYKGQRCYELYHQLEQPCPDCYALVALKTGEPATGIHQSPDNRYWKMNCVPIRNQSGELVGVLDTALEITDLVSSKEALKESEAYIKAIMDNLPIGVAVNTVKPNVLFTYMNDNFPKFYHTPREALDKPEAFWKTVYEDPQFREEIRKRVEDDCASGDPEKMHWDNVPITRGGEVVAYINATNTPLPDKNLMVSTVWDVTDRVKAEKALEESYALLRLAGETTKFGGWSVDLITNRVTWSEQVAMIHDKPSGYSPLVEEGISFYAPEWREKITAVFTACAEKGIPYDEEMEIITARGRRVWVRTAGEAVKDHKSAIVRVQGSFQDITEKQNLQEKLRKEQSQLIAIFNNIDEMIYIADPDTYEVLYVNKKLVDALGKDPVGGLCYQVFQGFNAPCDFCTNSIITADKTKPYLWEFFNPLLKRHFKIYDRIIKWPDDRDVRFEMAVDITELKNAEKDVNQLNRELEQRIKERTAELEAVNKELESFAYTISHDLRAPLRAMSGFSDNLTLKYSDQLDEKGRHYLDRIHQAALHMGDLINDLLKLSRITRGELNREQIDLSQLAAEILNDLLEQEPSHRVEVAVAPDLKVKGDSRLIKIMLENLLNNAWKFSAKKKQSLIEVGAIRENGKETFFVRDNGVGFDMTYADKLFVAFQRLHGVKEFPGTGVGLATVQRIINRHGGKVWAEGEVDKGAIFYFTLSG